MIESAMKHAESLEQQQRLKHAMEQIMRLKHIGPHSIRVARLIIVLEMIRSQNSISLIKSYTESSAPYLSQLAQQSLKRINSTKH